MLYFFGPLMLLWVIAVQCGCFSMRTPDCEWAAEMRRDGQTRPVRFVDIQAAGGRTIHAAVMRSSDSLPWVVLVHGSPGSADAFLHYLSDTLLTKKANLVALDRPGFGYTSGFGKPEPSQAAQAEAIKAVMDSLAPGQKITLVGHSLGATVAARFAMDYPASTAALVLAAGSIDPAREEHPWWQSAIDNPPLCWLTPKSFRTSNAEIIPMEEELKKMLPLWSNITCPVRVIHARNDRLVPVENADFARKMIKNSPDMQVNILEKGDHFFVWTDESILRNTLLDLLKQQVKPADRAPF